MILVSILAQHQQSITVDELYECIKIALYKIDKERVVTLYELLRYDDRLDIAMFVAIHELAASGIVFGVSPYDVSKANVPANLMFYSMNRN
jgi:hypothetical protein